VGKPATDSPAKTVDHSIKDWICQIKSS
jgi:hypothetical protein